MGIGSEAKDSVSLETRIQVRADPGWKPVCTDTKVINSALDSYQFLLRQRLGNTPDQDCVGHVQARKLSQEAADTGQVPAEICPRLSRFRLEQSTSALCFDDYNWFLASLPEPPRAGGSDVIPRLNRAKGARWITR